jgi:hypothetical protein
MLWVQTRAASPAAIARVSLDARLLDGAVRGLLPGMNGADG